MFQNDSKNINIPQAVTDRLPTYYRCLCELLRDDIYRIKSAELAEKLGVSASQLRQDLARFGEFGLRGYGYNVKYLYDRISEILGITNNYKAVLLGAGKIGSALAASSVFKKRTAKLCGIFDSDPAFIGTDIAGHTVSDISLLSDFCINTPVDILVIALSKRETEAIAHTLSSLPVMGIWNFSGARLNFDNIAVQNVDIEDTLMLLCRKISNNQKSKEDIV